MKNKAIEVCSVHHEHPETVKSVESIMPPDSELLAISELYKVFGDPTRIKILFALYESEMCVCDIAALLSMTQSAISHQLRVLKASKLVKFRRDGKEVYYSLDDEHIFKILAQGLEHIKE